MRSIQRIAHARERAVIGKAGASLTSRTGVDDVAMRSGCFYHYPVLVFRRELLSRQGFHMARHSRHHISRYCGKYCGKLNDARGIAQMMRLGWYRAVYVKNAKSQKLRTLLANRKLLKRKLIDVENHIRGALRGYGLFIGAISRGRYEARVRELTEHSDYIFKAMIETMLTVRQGIFDGYERLHKVLLQVVKHDAVCRRLMTVPGVGPVVALSFKLGVDDPLRFSRSRNVGAHFGLTPKHI